MQRLETGSKFKFASGLCCEKMFCGFYFITEKKPDYNGKQELEAGPNLYACLSLNILGEKKHNKYAGIICRCDRNRITPPRWDAEDLKSVCVGPSEGGKAKFNKRH